MTKHIILNLGVFRRLSEESESIGFGAGLFQKQDVWNLQEREYDPFPRVRVQVSAPLSGVGDQWAYTTEASLGIIQGRQSMSIEAHPRGWYPPAWWGDWGVWVEDDGTGGKTCGYIQQKKVLLCFEEDR